MKYFSQPVEAMCVPSSDDILGLAELRQANEAFQAWMDEQTERHCLGFEYEEEGHLFVFQSPLGEENPIEVAPGDWIVFTDDGVARSMTDEAFEATYVADQDRTKFREMVGTIAAGIREMRIESMANQLKLSRIESLAQECLEDDPKYWTPALEQILDLARDGLPAADMANVHQAIAEMDKEQAASAA